MYLFMLDISQETGSIAPIIVRDLPASGANLTARPRHFGAKYHGCFHGMTIGDMASTCWLGHADTKGIGDYDSADSFVDKFNSEFEKQFDKKNKNQVQHVYIVGCETGLIDSASMPVADQIANKLHGKGFTNVLVHAVANPPEANTSMIVKVVSRGQPPASLSGDMQAILLTNEQAARHASLTAAIGICNGRKDIQARRSIDNLSKQRDDIEKQGKLFLHTSHILAELSRPHNTFTPNQPHARPAKFLLQEQALVAVDAEIRKRAWANACVQNQPKLFKAMSQVCSGKKENKLENLRELRGAIAGIACVEGAWETNLLQLKSRFTTKACMALLDSFQKQIPCHVSGVSQSIAAMVAGGAGCLFAMPSKPEMPTNIRAAKRQIERHIEVLKTEKASSWITSGVKEYKIQQLDALVKNIQGAYDTNPPNPEWLSLIQAALQDEKLIQGVMQHRTYDLLMRIRDENCPSERSSLLVGNFS